MKSYFNFKQQEYEQKDSINDNLLIKKVSYKFQQLVNQQSKSQQQQQMSTNSLLSSLYGTSSHSNTTRSSSLFTKQYSFMSNVNQRKNRPSSVSKSIQNSSPNDLVKWTPLIKTVHKLSAKLKKDYFFFWCRMQACVKSKNKQIKEKKENNENKQNKGSKENKQNCITLNNNTQTTKISPQEIQQIHIEKIPLNQNINLLNEIENSVNILQSSALIQNKPLQIQQPKILPIQTQQIQSVNLYQSSKPIQVQIKQKQINPIDRNIDSLLQKNQQQKILKQKEKQKQTKLSNFVISLSKLNYKISSVILLSYFQSLKSNSNKKFAIHKICALKFSQFERTNVLQAVRLLKKHSHHIMKSQIIVNSLKSYVNKVKIQTVRYLCYIAKNEKAVIKSHQQIIKSQIKQSKQIIRPSFSLKNLPIEEHVEKQQQTPRFNISQNVISLQNESKAQTIIKRIEKQTQLQIPKFQPLKLSSAKNVTQFWFASTNKSFFNLKIDKPIEKHFNKEGNHERMKKLSRIYPQEPFLQLPDISQITLFDSVIKNNSTLFEKKRSQNKSINTSLVSSIKLYTSREKQSSLNSTDNYSKEDLPFSPRFDEHMNDSKNSQQLFRKASSCANITVIKNSSSSNLKSNPHTPGSAKKIVGLFSKKKSVQLFSKDSAHKNYQSKLQSAKSAVLKKFDLFTQIKSQKQKQHQKSKIIQSSSKQLYRIQSNKKKEKYQQKIHQVKNPSVLNFSQSKKNQSSNKKLYHNGSSKVVQKFYDMSARRIGTTSKKQISTSKKQNQNHQNRNLYEKSSSKKNMSRNESCKQNQLSEFNTLSNKVISYEEFMKHFPAQKSSTGRTPLKQVCENEPIFQTIQMTEQDLCSKDLNECYSSCSAQLPKRKNDNNQQKSKKLRSKIEKIEMNTARKMKMEIQNMISQRKKSSIGILKF